MPFYVKNKNRKTAYTSLFIALSLVVIIGWGFQKKSAFAQSNTDSIRLISISASLFNSENKVVTNGTYQVRFALYPTNRTTADPFPSNSDTKFWEETQTVEVKNGIFRASLGGITPFPATLNFDSGDFYVGIRIAEDSEMVPRKKLGSVPRAFNSQFLQGRTIGTGEGNIPLLGSNGKLDSDVVPTSAIEGFLADDDKILDDIHAQNSDTGTTEEIFNIGSGTGVSGNNFDLTVSSASNAPTLRYNGSTQAWQLSNDGTTFDDISSGTSGIINLGTDTDGDYVASIISGNGISGGLTGEGSTPTLSINLLDSTDGTGVASSNSGLEFGGAGSNELTLLQGCTNGQGLAWNDTTNVWECGSFSAGIGGSGTAGQVTYWTGASSLSSEAQLATVRGGTGVDGSASANGSLLIGNGTGYTLSTLTQGAGVTVTNGAGSITIASTLGTSVDLTTEVTGTLPVGNGGTGAITLTSNGVVIGNGTGAVQVTAAGTNGQLFLGSTGVAPVFATLSGDATITNAGVLSISADSIALTTDTTGNYVATINSGNGISGSSASEGGTPTIAIDLLDSADGAGAVASFSGLEFQGSGTNELTLLQGCAQDDVLSWNNTTNEWGCASVSGVGGATASGSAGQAAYFSGTSSLQGEAQLATVRGGTGVDGSTAANGTLLIGNGSGYSLSTLTQGTGITITNGVGTITVASTLGASIDLSSEVTGILPVANGGTGASSLNDLIALGTNTTGNYIASIASGNGIAGGVSSEGGTPTLSIDLLDSADSVGAISSNSGLEFGGAGNNELTLLQGCTNNDVLSWNNTTDTWNCSSVSGAGGITGTGTAGQAAYFTSSSVVASEAQLSPIRGGTGVNGSAAANGSLLIGNGTGYTLGTLTDGAGITITNGTGTITVASTLGASVDLTSEVNGILPVANGGTGASSLTNLITLTTDTTGNYVATITNGNGISGSSSTEGGTPTIALGDLTADWNQTFHSLNHQEILSSLP
jgi:hypothetical protein